MKNFYVKDAAQHDDKVIISFFAVVSKQTMKKRNGEPYMRLTLGDRTGVIEAKLWEKLEMAAGVAPEGWVKLRGRINEYFGRREIAIDVMRAATDDEVDIGDLIPATARSIDVMWIELAEFIESVQRMPIRQLLRNIFFEDEAASSLFRRAPAAKIMHHAYLGGLLEHVVSLCQVCHLLQKHYSWLDRDLLLAGAILHDIGKIHELSYGRAFGYTDRGQLLGHIAIGLQLVHAK